MNGAHIRVVLETVQFGPGASAPPHTHSCPVVGYVLDGAIESKVKGSPPAVYHAGQSFFEPAHGIHEIAKNQSGTRPAALLAIYVCDTNAPLTLPAAAAENQRH